MSNQALKVKCPFCELMFAARYAFHQHLCDKHFKDALAQQVPLHPPYQCPAEGCAYIARDSRQSLIRHFGMTHKVVVELLKRHVPDYETIDPFPTDEHHHVQQPEAVQQQQVFYHQPPPPPQQQFQQEQMQDALVENYYQQEYQQHHHMTQQQQQVIHQQPHIMYGQQQQQQGD